MIQVSRLKGKLSIYIGGIVMLLFNTASAQSGALDNTFSNDGKSTLAIGDAVDFCSGSAIQSDGKIVLAGYSYLAGSSYNFAIVRYNTNGTPDNTFDQDGIVTTSFGPYGDEALSIGIQSDGKIVVAGSSYNGGNTDVAIARYLQNGRLDSTFSDDGMLTTAIGNSNDVAYAIAIQSDGKIVIGGARELNGNYDFALVRYNGNGSLDSSFATDGILTTAAGSGQDRIYALAIQQDGKILAAGSAELNSYLNFAAARYNSDGIPDSMFAVNGLLITSMGVDGADCRAMAIQTDQKIILAGSSYSNNNSDFAIARYHSDGSLDTSFSTDGKLITSIGNYYDFGWAVALQNNGKILMAGSSSNGNDNDFALVRFNSNGTLDSNFDTDGKVSTAIGSGIDVANSLLIQNDGKIIAAGYSEMNGHYDFAVARYNGNTSSNQVVFKTSYINVYPNPTFNLLTISFEDAADSIQDAGLQIFDAQGKLVHLQSLTSAIETIRLHLPAGVYHYKIYIRKNELAGLGNIVVQ